MTRILAALLALSAAAPAASRDAPLPPRPDDPWRGWRAPSAPPPHATLGGGPIAPAGSQTAPLHPDDGLSSWRFSLATGVAGRAGGTDVSSERDDPRVLLYFGGQADGLWGEGYGRAARLRVRLFTGGESGIYVPSEGDAEAALMLGRREFRFVVGRVEVGRYPALAIDTLVQIATLPCFEGSVALAGDAMRLSYHLSPIEGAWVRYHGDAHIPHGAEWATESDRPTAATAARLRYTALLTPAVLVSAQADLLKMWSEADLLLSAEGGLGYQAFQQTAVFSATVRWDAFTRRGVAPQTTESESEVLLLGTATLVF